jgi:hypothetical protein
MEQGGKKFNRRLRFALQGDGLGMMFLLSRHAVEPPFR